MPDLQHSTTLRWALGIALWSVLLALATFAFLYWQTAAFLREELAETLRLEVRAAAADPAVAERIAAHRALRADLSRLFAGAADEPVPDRLVAAIGASQAPSAEVLAFRPRAAPRPLWMQAAAMAACLVAGIALTLAVDGNKSDIATRHGLMVAQGPLARALSTQLAADTAGPVRIRSTASS